MDIITFFKNLTYHKKTNSFYILDTNFTTKELENPPINSIIYKGYGFIEEYDSYFDSYYVRSAPFYTITDFKTLYHLYKNKLC